MIRTSGAQQHATAACGTDGSSVRTCIVTRAALPPEQLVRFVLSPDGVVTPDITRKLPGRGVWVSCRRPTVELAVKGGAFAKSLRSKVVVPGDLGTLVDALLLKRSLELLSLCNKAGLVATGAGKVASWTDAGGDGTLVQASDASPDGLAKVARKFRAVREAIGATPVEVISLTINELSLAIGRENVVHAALRDGKAAANFLASIRRLEQFRSAESETPDPEEPAAGQPGANQNTGQV